MRYKKNSANTPESEQNQDSESKIIYKNKVDASEHDANLNLLANIAPVMLWLSGTDKSVYFVNRIWIEFRGTSFEEEIGNNWLNGLHKDDIENVEKMYIDAFDAREPFYFEYRLLHNDGGYRWVSSKGAPRFTADGTFLGYAGSCADIDTQKNFANKLKEEVDIRTEEVNQKNIELKRKNEDLNSFASVASHDLKEPLRKIHMFGKMIQDRESEKLSDTSKYNLERILVSTTRMEQLVNDLLSYSEIGSEAVFLKTDLNLLLNEVMTNLKETIEESEATIDMDTLPELDIIPSQFSQVFTNLIHNAIKYSKKDVLPIIKITCEVIKGESIRNLDANINRNYYKITVKDNGVGFPNEINEKVFDPFKRFHDREKYSGTGIGLAICKKILLQHKGFITAESEVEKGASFSMYLPQ